MKLKRTKSDLIFDVVVYFILTSALFVVIMPLIFVVSASFSDPGAVYRGEVWLWPVNFSLEGYNRVFKNTEIWMGYKNSLLYSAGFVLTTLSFTLPAAYALSRNDLRGKGFFMGYFLVTMFFGGGLIPTYMLIKELNMIDTVWVLLIPGAVSAYNLLITRSFFNSTIPEELLNAAQIDGCNNFKFFTAIVLPLSKPIIAVISLFAGIGMWNQYFSAMLFLSTRELYPLQLFLREILVQSEFQSQMMGDIAGLSEQQRISEVVKFSLIIVSSVPMLVAYPFVQKHFVKGVMIGAIKG